ncbi:MAG: vWA domain-containing protein [Pseudomonadota bacterium]
MNKIGLIIPLLVFLAACDPVANSGTTEPQTTTNQAKAAVDEFYARRPTQYTWPAVSKSSGQDSGSLLTKNYYLVIDGSGSMEDSDCSGNQRKIDVAKTAVAQFVGGIPADANVGLFVFDQYGIKQRVALGEHHAEVQQQVQNISASGGTPLLHAVNAAYQALTVQAQKQYGYGEYHMVIVTDGEASKNEDPGDLVTKIIRESPVTIHTIGFCIGTGHSLNVPGITNYSAASNPEELLSGLQNVLAESSQYVMDSFDEATFDKAKVAP